VVERREFRARDVSNHSRPDGRARADPRLQARFEATRRSIQPGEVLFLQRMAGNLAVSRLIDPVAGEWVDQAPSAPTAPAISDQDIVDIETATIAEKLKSFREIKVYVKGPAEMKPAKPPGISQEIPGAPGLDFDLPHYPLKEVTVHAAYFINTTAAQTSFHSANSFKKVVKALKQKTLIETGEPPNTQQYSQGQAVNLGKSTPDDVQAFVDEALEQGAVKTYAHATEPFKGQFPAGKTELFDLPDTGLHDVIQQWITDNGVGVDCSGFVLQAAIAVREKIQAAYKAKGIPVPDQYKEGISHTERSASSFASGTARSSPKDIKLGDAWVIGTHHVRIVASTPFEVDGQIQFDADESYGDSSQTTVGPIGHTWRTHSTTAFNTMTRLKDGGDPSKKTDYENKPQGTHGFYAIS
jgi:hypothetical protein